VPVNVADARARYEIPFGALERAERSGEEVPGLRWADVAGRAPGRRSVRGAGCAVLNDCKYGHSLDGNVLRVTLLRSSYDPDPRPEVGDHTVRLALAPHGAARSNGDLMCLGAAFNQPLHVLPADRHAGDLPGAGAAVRGLPPNAVLTALKRTEDGNRAVLRLLETDGKAVTATVVLDSGLLGEVESVAEVDLLERKVSGSKVARTRNGFRVRLAPHAIVSVAVTWRGAQRT